MRLGGVLRELRADRGGTRQIEADRGGSRHIEAYATACGRIPPSSARSGMETSEEEARVEAGGAQRGERRAALLEFAGLGSLLEFVGLGCVFSSLCVTKTLMFGSALLAIVLKSYRCLSRSASIDVSASQGISM